MENEKTKALRQAISSWIPETQVNNSRRQKQALDMIDMLNAELRYELEKELPDYPKGLTYITRKDTGQQIDKQNRALVDPAEIRKELRTQSFINKIPLDLVIMTVYQQGEKPREYWIQVYPPTPTTGWKTELQQGTKDEE